MSQWNVTFADGSFVIIKDVPPGVTEADVIKEISQQPKYKGKTAVRATDVTNVDTTPSPATNVKPPAEKPPVNVKPTVKPPETVKPPTVKPTVKPPASEKKTPPDPSYKPPVTNPNVAPGSGESIRQPDGTYRVDIAGTAKDEVKPPSNTSPGAPGDDVINDAVKKQEEADKSKKAAAEADAKARKSKEDADRKEALDKQKEARIAQEKADQAKKAADAAEKDKIIGDFKKDGEDKIKQSEPAKEPAKTTTAEPAKEPAKTTTAEPAKEPAKTTTAEPAKSNEPEGPSLWDRIKSGAKEVGQAIGGAVTPSSEPTQTPAPAAQTPAPPSKEQLKADIESKLAELEKSSDPAVRERAKAARAKLNGQPGNEPGGSGSGAKVQPTGPNPGGGGKTDIGKTSGTGTDGPGTGQGPKPGTGPGKSFDNPTGTQPGAGTGQQGAPGTGTQPGKAPGTQPGPGNKPVPAGDSDVDGDKIRKQRREQEAELKRLQQLPDKTANTSSGGWRDAGFGTRVWRGGPGTDTKWPGYVFNDGDIMPAGNYSTGVGNSRTTTYSGNAGTDQYDRQGVDKLLYDRERQAQEIERLKKQKGVKEDVDRILKLAGLNK